MTRWKYLILTLNIVVLCSCLFPTNSFAQDNNDDGIEVYLEFRHRGIINSVVISYYKDNQFYLPVSELFSLFQIDHEVNGLVISGRFSTAQTPYTINFPAKKIRFGDKVYEITADDYLLKEIDSYIRPELFDEVFGLDFTIDFNNLTLELQTTTELPTIMQALRKQRRRLADQNRYSEERYELKYGREKPFLDGGFIDYNLSSNISSGTNVYNANTNLGIQVYGGDLQGTIYGSYSENYSNLSTDNLRWRYFFRDNPGLTKLAVGQTRSDGLIQNSYSGIRLTNEPIEPRRLFDEFVVQGSTIPESEVELYMNNNLIDFQMADEMGDYRFLTPITYGSSQLDLKIYGPTGQVIERSNRIQVPFTFQPEGVFNYTLNAGILENPIFGSTNQDFTAQTSGSYGITDWLTAKAGVEYYQGYHETLPSFSSTLSSRIMSNYILTLEGASNAYYRTVINAIYPNSASFSVDYIDYTSGFGIYNPSNDDKRFIASVFYPFNLFKIPFNFRVSTFSRIREMTSSTTFRVDANSRLGRVNFRVGYTDRYSGDFNILEPTGRSYVETSATYTISRNRNVPAYIRGAFFRAQLRYMPVLQEFESAEFQVSQSILQKGRLQLSFGRNFFADFYTIRFGLVIDLDKVRSNTTFNSIRGSSTITQNVRGSVGYDSNYNNFILTSRNQVGRAASAIKMFVDNNNDGTFNEGDNPIAESGVRIDRSGAKSISKDGILYMTQMQPYYYYNMEMNKSEIKNPMLVPDFEKFGVITDPNRFKKIEIPFYMSGVIQGSVERQYASGTKKGVGGLKLTLRQQNGDFESEIRTFSDGSFYDYEIPPGEYKITIEESNLEVLKSRATPPERTFTVEAVPEGDFIEGLHFLLVPEDMQPRENQESVTNNVGISRTANNSGGLSIEYNIQVDSLQSNACRYGIQLGAFSTLEAAKRVADSGMLSGSYIVYNSPRRLYAVRTGLYQNLGDASLETRRFNNSREQAAVLNQCYGSVASSYIPSGTQFDLQFAAFANSYRAEVYLADFNRKYNLNAYQIQDQEDYLYKIKVGPFETLQEAKNRQREILRTTPIREIYVSKEEYPARMINVDFEYVLQLGVFETAREAALYAIRVEDNFNEKSRILIDEKEQVILILDKIYSDWNQIKTLKSIISGDDSFEEPVIHLKEQKL